MPDVARSGEVEEVLYAEAFHVLRRRCGGEAMEREFQWVHGRAHVQRCPLAYSTGVDRTHLEVIVGLWREVVKGQLIAAYRGIVLALELHLIIIGVVHALPFRRYGIWLHVGLEQLWRGKCARALLQPVVLGQLHESLHGQRHVVCRDVGLGYANGNAWGLLHAERRARRAWR